MRIAEIFYSIQGEGSLVGVPSVFIRTSGCNLRCSWCDTPYTSWDPEGEHLTVAKILERIAEFGAGAYAPKHAVLTGGEPMIASGITELSERLRERGMHITVETAGTVFTPVACDLMSISPKLSNSKPQGIFEAHHEKLRMQPEVLCRLMVNYDYQLKFVIARPEDLEEVRAVVESVGAPAEKVMLMPEGTSDAVLNERGKWVAELCKQHGFRFSQRLHVHLYGHRRGV